MKNQKSRFNLDPEIVYLNMGYMSPSLKAVTEAGIEGVRKKEKPYLISPDDFFKNTKRVKHLFSKIIDNPLEERIAMIPSVSYGMANVVRNIPIKSKGNIILVKDQFPSNFYPWSYLAKSANLHMQVIGRPQGLFSNVDEWNYRILSAITESTVAVAISQTHWADGSLFDLKAIGKKAKRCGARFIVDGTQSVGALPISVSELQIDALICAGYKWLLGPYSIGMAYYGPEFDQGIPIEENWINRVGSENFGGLVNYQEAYKMYANRFSVGESSNFVLLPMMITALLQILDWTPSAIQEYCRGIGTSFFEELERIGFYFEPEANRVGHLFAVHLDPNIIDKSKLIAELKRQQVYVSFRGDYLRISPYVYNSEPDLLQLAHCIKNSI